MASYNIHGHGIDVTLVLLGKPRFVVSGEQGLISYTSHLLACFNIWETPSEV